MTRRFAATMRIVHRQECLCHCTDKSVCATPPDSPTLGDFSVAGGAMPRRVEGGAFELPVRANGAQHQTAARHVAESRKRGGKAQPLLKNGPEDVDVLAAGDAAEKDDLRVRLELAG